MSNLLVKELFYSDCMLLWPWHSCIYSHMHILHAVAMAFLYIISHVHILHAVTMAFLYLLSYAHLACCGHDIPIFHLTCTSCMLWSWHSCIYSHMHILHAVVMAFLYKISHVHNLLHLLPCYSNTCNIPYSPVTFDLHILYWGR